MKAKKYVLSLATVYMCYLTHGIQALILSQNQANFYTQWGYVDATAGAAAVSLAITATGFGKMLSVWIGGEISDRIGRKKMMIAGSLLYIVCFIGLLFTTSFTVACAMAFLAGVATSGFWDAAGYPAVQEAAPDYAGTALIGIKFFVSLSSFFYPFIVVWLADMGQWKVSVWIPLVMSIICTVLALIASFAYDDQMKEMIVTKDGKKENAAQAEIDEIKAKMLVKPSGLVNFFTMFYGFLCMFIMYGAQQYTKAFGMNNCGLTEMQSAGLTSIYTFGSIAAVIFWAFMMGKLKWNPLKVVLIDSVFTALALVIVLLVRQVFIIYIAIALIGFFAAGGALQTGLRVRQLLCPGPKGRNTGIYYTWMGLASCFLPYIVSAMTKSAGQTQAVYIMMVLLLIAAVVAVLMMSYLVGQYKKVFGENPLSKQTT